MIQAQKAYLTAPWLTLCLNKVAILLIRMSDGLRSPFVALGISETSVGSCQLACVVMKQTVKSRLVSARTTAGLNFEPLKSVKGKVMSTMSPLAIVHFF